MPVYLIIFYRKSNCISGIFRKFLYMECMFFHYFHVISDLFRTDDRGCAELSAEGMLFEKTEKNGLLWCQRLEKRKQKGHNEKVGSV